ncbi:MAG TPA: response regulator transcription factor [Polyangiaceae bacterium]|nr:response regulator transcription factor [Polyangiaceae bacterium]
MSDRDRTQAMQTVHAETQPNANEQTQVALVSAEPVLCAGLAELMRSVSDLHWAGCAGDARAAFELIEHAKPAVALMDVPLPGMDGICATRELRWRMPSTRVLMFSRLRELDVALALEAGAWGFALKTDPFEALLDGVRCVARGERYLAPVLRRHPLFGAQAARRRLRHPVDQVGVLASLSPRELELAKLLARGWNAQRVATEVCLSPKTVCTHRARIYRKLGCHSIAELVRLAALSGLLDRDT